MVHSELSESEFRMLHLGLLQSLIFLIHVSLSCDAVKCTAVPAAERPKSIMLSPKYDVLNHTHQI